MKPLVNLVITPESLPKGLSRPVSFSSLTQFVEHPYAFFPYFYFGVKSSQGVYAARGQHAEDVLIAGKQGFVDYNPKTRTEFKEVKAWNEWNKHADKGRQELKKSLAPCPQLGRSARTQIPVSAVCPITYLPLRGFKDLGNSTTTIDIKSVNRLPVVRGDLIEKARAKNVRQLAFYRMIDDINNQKCERYTLFYTCVNGETLSYTPPDHLLDCHLKEIIKDLLEFKQFISWDLRDKLRYIILEKCKGEEPNFIPFYDKLDMLTLRKFYIKLFNKLERDND